MQIENGGTTRNIIINGSIFIAALSVMAYGLTLAYELGFANAFGIPYQLIRINLIDMLNDLLNLWGVLILPLLIVNAVPMFIMSYDQRIKARISILIPFLFVALAFFSAYPKGYLRDWDWILFVIASGIIILFV